MQKNYIKFTYENASDSDHWEYCQKHKIPFILIKSVGKNKSEIFYDITDLNIDLHTISQKIKTIFQAYHSFFFLSENLEEKYENQPYFFTFPVQKEHSECIANQLFDFLISEISSI